MQINSNKIQIPADYELAAALNRRFEQLKILRQSYTNDCINVATFFKPQYRDCFIYPSHLSTNKSSESQLQALTGKCFYYLRTWTNTIKNQVFPSSFQWHAFEPYDRKLRSNRAVTDYCENVTNLLFMERKRSGATGFETAIYQLIEDCGAFGTGAIYIDSELKNNKFNKLQYRHIPIGELFLQHNHVGVIDTLFRYFQMTARSLIDQFGEENIGNAIKKHAENDKDRLFDCLHVVEPDGDNFKSIYLTLIDKNIVLKSQYQTMPYIVGKWASGNPTLPYGTSPAILATSTSRVLNNVMRDYIKSSELAHSPPIAVRDLDAAEGFKQFQNENGLAGAVIAGAISEDGRSLVQPIMMTNPQVIDKMVEMLDDELKKIFLYDEFSQLNSLTQRMTASEANIRYDTNNRLSSPQIENLSENLIHQIVRREIDLLERANVIIDAGIVMPPELIGKRDKVKIVNKSNAVFDMNKPKIATIRQTLQDAVQISTAIGSTEPLDALDINRAVEYIVKNSGAPHEILKTQEELDAIKAERQNQKYQEQQRAQAEQLVQSAPAAASLIKAVSPKGIQSI